MERTFRVGVVDLQKGILTADLELFAFESQQLPTLYNRVHVDEGGLGISFPSQEAAGGRVGMSTRQ